MLRMGEPLLWVTANATNEHLLWKLFLKFPSKPIYLSGSLITSQHCGTCGRPIQCAHFSKIPSGYVLPGKKAYISTNINKISTNNICLECSNLREAYSMEIIRQLMLRIAPTFCSINNKQR